MVFSSIEFLLYFFPLFFVVYALTPAKYRNVWLLFGSMFFYTWGDPAGMVLLLVSIPVNFFLGLHLGGAQRKRDKKNSEKYRKRQLKRKWILGLAIVGNLGVLAYYKSQVNVRALPMGISFYTFQFLSYLIDVYRGTIPREQSLIPFASYVLMFPKITSGPITRYGTVVDGLKKTVVNSFHIQSGLGIFTAGLAYKVILADKIGILWNNACNVGFESLSPGYAWLAAIAFSMKLYFDFYGYSLMAMGLGKMMGFQLPKNFNHPYMASSVREFYRRWHFTLGDWFKDYVYIPLGGSRKGELRTDLNLLIVWFLTGIWHGETLNFLIWSGSLFFFIVLERMIVKLKFVKKLKILPHIYLWTVIPITWVCFAITDLGDLYTFFGRMFGFVPGINVRNRDWLYVLNDFKYLFLVCFFACTPILEKLYMALEKTFLCRLMMAVLFWMCVWRISIEGENPFMYLQF